MVNESIDVPNHVATCLQLGILLEVSAYPKPGNVHRVSNFQKTMYEHFLASAVSVGPHFRHAAQKSLGTLQNRTGLKGIGVGRLIKEAVTDVMAWQGGGNTLLGSIILLTPMAAAAAITLRENDEFRVPKFRAALKAVVEATTPKDAAGVYDAITIAQPGGLGKAPQLDVTDADSKRKILKKNISLYDVFKISSTWDSISAEWTNNFHVTFDIGFPFFQRQLKKANDVNTATVHTYVKILSEVPDTLITRKAGSRKSKWVSAQAAQVLKAGGLSTCKGRRSLLDLDLKLRDAEHKLNPGTTADITSAVLSIATLSGYRP